MTNQISYSALFELFNAGISSGLKYPKFRFSVNGTILVVKLNGSMSRYQGSIALANDARFGTPESRYYGRIEPNGGLVAGRDLTPELEAFVQKLAADPIGTCAENGKLTGNCVFCQKPLTDGNSLAAGYGPVCAKKFHLPWNAAKEARKSRQKSVAVESLAGFTTFNTPVDTVVVDPAGVVVTRTPDVMMAQAMQDLLNSQSEAA